jgi:hypothetical protein
MQFDLAMAPGDTHAVVTVRCDLNHATATEYQRAMRAFAEAHAVSRFLIDTRGRRFVGTFLETYTFVRDTLPKEGFDETWTAAVVTSPDDDSHDFLETVSFNAGRQIRVFKDYEQAARWLTKEVG